MEQIITTAILAILGLMMGSFAGASVWRLRARQLVGDKASGEGIEDEKEYKKLLPLTKAHIQDDRSRCLHCGHTLAWFDLIPLASWVSIGGKCRYCHKRIGNFEPLMELGVASFFVGMYLLFHDSLQTPLSFVLFSLVLISGVMLAILFAYDLKWFLLPDVITFPFIAISVVIAGIHIITAPDAIAALLSTIGAVGILSGIYLSLWLYSKGEWIGFGDVKLGLGLALLLSDWHLAFLALFSANLAGCLVVIPGLVSGKMTRSTRVPFGPLLIVGSLVALIAGDFFIEWCKFMAI